MVISETNAAVVEGRDHVREQGPRLRIRQWTRLQSGVVHATNVRAMGKRAYIAARDRSSRVDLVLNSKVELVRVRILDMRIIVPVRPTCEEGCRCRQPRGTSPRRERISVGRRRDT